MNRPPPGALYVGPPLGAGRGQQLTVLVALTVGLSVMELLFQYLYLGSVPLPVGTLLIVTTMPWLVRATVETWPTTAGAALVPVLWFVTTAVVGVFGPGGDTLLVPVWQTLLLLVTGVLVGMVCFRRAVEYVAVVSTAGADRPARPSDPRIGEAGRPR